MATQHKIFLDRAPSIRIKNGVAHVFDAKAELDHVLSLECLQDCVSRSQRALDRYAAGERDVVEDD